MRGTVATMERLIATLAAFLCCFCASAANQQPASRPNVIFILADDIGYGDLSCYGAKGVKTPVLDQLAAGGRRFTDAHSAASTCSPSRRALMTGVYSWRQRPGSAILPGDAPLSISPGTFTLPAVFKKAGYRTGVVGKWHLGLGGPEGPDWNSDLKPGPLEIGFDYAFVFPATGDRVPTVFIENHHVVGLDPSDPIQVNYKQKVGTEPTGRENPELLTLKAVQGHDNTIVNGIGRIGWMTGGKSARWKDEQVADTFTSKAVAFIERNRTDPFFLYFATHNIHVPRVPAPRHIGKSELGRRGDAIMELDASVGEVLKTLDRLALTSNTLVIFTSDNGGIMNDGYEDVGKFEHACNGVLRGFKSSVWEGGHRVPFIARWPGRIPSDTHGDDLITHVDMVATFATLLGEGVPERAAIDSRNVLPALLGKPHPTPGRTTFITHVGGIEGPFGVRSGDWMLVQGGGRGWRARADRPATPPQLFNLKDDVSQKNDLAAQHPEMVKELMGLLQRERDKGGPADGSTAATAGE